ncbi:MAG: branched-chain amino acid transport system permease protein [Moorella sp. (in: firmicutes)]|nr:branched-chain amino acid transport system permease protein [Moorella sp. (in: firmicutes)]
MDTLIQTIINGLMIGGVYALVAVGLTLIFGVMGIVNFAQGEFVMLGMYGSWILASLFRISPYPGILIIGPLMFLIGFIFYKLLISRVVGKGDEAYILLTLGLSILLQNLALIIWGADYQSVATPLKDAAIHVSHLSIPIPRLIAFVIGLGLIIGLTYILHKTDLGRAMRACAENREVACLLGINPNQSFTIAFSLGIVLAGIGGSLLTPMFYVYPTVGVLFNTTAFIVVVLGGMGSVAGALLGGLIIGIVEALTGTYISLDLSQLGTFVIFLLVLFLRPSGLFGRSVR